ncbi:MAG: replicative DNA helicase [Pseudonocardia sp.]|nr:replicative DNA helicase [Pseudonocardia sp.]
MRAAGDGADGSGAGSPFDRQPPQDLIAEQSVLGGMLLSKDAIADVVEVLRPDDFYKPAHQTVYDTILDLYGRGEPADAVTVSAELQRHGDLIRLGGAPYLHTLIATVPTAANAAYYAEIVAEKAVLRRLVQAGTRIVQLGYHGADGAEVAEVVDRAQATLYDVTERSTSEDYVALEELLQPTMDEIDAIASRGGVALGVPTGFADLDAATNGLHPGQMIVVAARPGLGKALALDTPLPTPSGWTTMGEVAAGDELLGADGRPTRVLRSTDVMTGRPCFEVGFSDGTVIVADAGHEWAVWTELARSNRRRGRLLGAEPVVLTTEQISACLAEGVAVRPRLGVRAPEPLQTGDQERLPVAPYVLGAWLGAGDSRSGRLTFADQDVVDRVRADGLDVVAQRARHRYRIRGLRPALRDLGVLHDGHVPAAYLRASEKDRRALLAGLLDTDGSVTSGGHVRFRNTSRRLADAVFELAVSLGFVAHLRQEERSGFGGRRFRDQYLVSFTPGEAVFGSTRKNERCSSSRQRSEFRYIADVRPIASVPVRCVEVDNADHLYLAGRSMIPTHNSTLGLDFARSCSVKHGMTSAVFSLEMSKSEIVMRLLSAEARIRLADMRAGRMSDDDWTRMARRMSEISEAPLFIDDSPNLTLMEIRAKARRLKQRNDLKLVILDYLQLMSSGRKVESRQQEVSEFSRQIKLLAKELEVPVVAISQLNRGPEQRTDKRPMLSDLRESGSIEQDADMVILLHRPDAFERDDPRAGEADLILAKHRNGPTNTITVAHQLHYSRFADLAHG